MSIETRMSEATINTDFVKMSELESYDVVFKTDAIRIAKEYAEDEIKFYKKALERIANEFGVVDPIQLIMKAENDEENYVDILIKIIRERLATDKDGD